MKSLKRCTSLALKPPPGRDFRHDPDRLTHLDLLLRALASPSRLAILSILFESPEDLARPEAAPIRPETRPGSLAHALSLHPTTVSHHLRALLRLRLVRYVKKGRAKFYAMARVRNGSLREFLLVQLRKELGDSPLVPPAHRPRSDARRTRPRKHGAIRAGRWGPLWNALTAFSHFRRLLMLRAIARPQGAGLGELCRAADLSPATVAYHLDKLARREVIVPRYGPGGEVVYGLNASAPTPMQAAATVVAALALGAAPGVRRRPPME